MQVHGFNMQTKRIEKSINHRGSTTAYLQLGWAFEDGFVFQHQRYGD